MRDIKRQITKRLKEQLKKKSEYGRNDERSKVNRQLLNTCHTLSLELLSPTQWSVTCLILLQVLLSSALQ